MHHHSHGSPGDSSIHGHRFHHPFFGRRGGKSPFGPGMHGHVFAAFAEAHGRARRGDVRPAILRLLSEQPMHGYQIIQELSQRSGGAWSPSAGSVYPTLQQLADEGLISAEETGGKKVFSLTEAGHAAVAEMSDQPAPWEESAQADTSAAGEYRAAAHRLLQAMWQIGTSGSTSQIEAATAIVTEARKKLYELLAED